jgi:cytochrome c peroxidase
MMFMKANAYSGRFRITVKAAIVLLSLATGMFSCSKEKGESDEHKPVDSVYKPTPYTVTIRLGFPDLPVVTDNPLTVEGVALGKKLFYDPILSRNGQLSCAGCHDQQHGFSDYGKQFSTGVRGLQGTRNAMPLFNLAWTEKFAGTEHKFFWDGRKNTLEDQVTAPITDPLEMDDSLSAVLVRLKAHSEYPGLFKKAFGTDVITIDLMAKAIAQYERTIISGNTRFDYFRVWQQYEMLTQQEQLGKAIFEDTEKGDCFHCHTLESAFATDFKFKHNGHKSTDKGLMAITHREADEGKFRTASLRNLVFTAPYMHDGRLATLEDVVEFYNSQALRTTPADENIAKHKQGLGLTTEEKAALVAFLKTLTDSALLTNPAFRP